MGYSCFQGSSLFPQDSLLSLNRESLFLLEVNWVHVGEYTCRAENIEGVDSASATVKLQSKFSLQYIHRLLTVKNASP